MRKPRANRKEIRALEFAVVALILAINKAAKREFPNWTTQETLFMGLKIGVSINRVGENCREATVLIHPAMWPKKARIKAKFLAYDNRPNLWYGDSGEVIPPKEWASVEIVAFRFDTFGGLPSQFLDATEVSKL